MSELLTRTFEVQGVEVEGRMVDVRVVPFGEVARVADPPDYREYREEWMPGVFDHQVKAANHIHANYEHERGVVNIVGHGHALRREADGYHATFKIHNTNAGDTALELLRDGALPGVSLEANPHGKKCKSVRTADGVVQRLRADLRGIAFCRTPAFAGAQVLALRSEPLVWDEELLPIPIDPAMLELARKAAIIRA